MKFQQVVRAWAAAAAIPLAITAAVGPQAASAATGPAPAQAGAAADGQLPTTPHIFHIAGLGGCEIDMRIALSADESDTPPAVRYQVFANGTLVETVPADTRGSAPGFGNLDVFGSRSGGMQTFTIAGADSDGNRSALSDAITHNFGGPC